MGTLSSLHASGCCHFMVQGTRYPIVCWVRQRTALSAPLKLYSPNQHATGLPVRGCVSRLVFLSSMVTLRLLAMESLCLPPVSQAWFGTALSLARRRFHRL